MKAISVLVLGALGVMSVPAGADTLDIVAQQGTQLASSWNDDVGNYTGDYNTGRANSFLIQFGSYYVTDALIGFDLQPILAQVDPGETLVINTISLTLTREAGDYGTYNPLWVSAPMGAGADNWSENVITYDDYYAANPFGSTQSLGTMTTPDYSDFPSAMTLDLAGLPSSSAMDDGYLSLLVMAGDWTWTSPTYLYGMNSPYAPSITVDYSITAVPEPETLALFLAGLAGLAWKQRSRVARGVGQRA
jgi:hypothetical protein